MSTIKNGEISLYFYFNKIMNGPGTNFQSPALSQQHVRNVCHTAHKYLTKFHFDSTQDSKEISIMQLPLCSNDYDDVTDFEICEFHKNTKSRYLENETFFLQIKKSLITH